MITTKEKSLEPTSPLALFCILGNNFFSTYFFSGLSAIFPLYLVEVLDLSQKGSTFYYHVFCMLVSAFPLFAGLLGDSKLGQYRTILYFTLICVAGAVVILIASTPIIPNQYKRLFTCIATLALSLGSGCSSVITPFGGDQFASSKKLSLYFSLSYFISNISALLATLFSPILRHDYQCFNQDTCFPLVFTFIGITMVLSLAFFMVGKTAYIHRKPERNIIKDVIQCASFALSKRFDSEDKKKHWLDLAEEKYSPTLIADTKAAFSSLWWMLPTPIFWALNDQMSSTWVFQAMQMDGSLGWYTIKPDQMPLLSYLLTIVLVPLVEMFLYPQLARCHLLERPLERLPLAGHLAAASYVIAAILEIKIQGSIPQLPGDNTAQLRVFNGLNCNIMFNNPLLPSQGHIPPLGNLNILSVPQLDTSSHSVSFTTGNDCNFRANFTFSGSLVLEERKASSLFLHSKNNFPVVSQVPGFDRIDKSSLENPKLRILYNVVPPISEVSLRKRQYLKTFKLNKTVFTTPLLTVLQTGKFRVTAADKSIPADVELGPSGIYTLILYSNNTPPIGRLVTVVPPNNIHILWQLPQYLAITTAVIILTITGNKLSYTEAPESMKSFISVAWTMTDAVGNLIVCAVILLGVFQNQVTEYLFYSGLMFFSSFMFNYISSRFEYCNHECGSQ